MLRTVKIESSVYDRLNAFRCKDETRSQAVDRLLSVWEGLHQVSGMMSGAAEFARWKAEQQKGTAPEVG